MLSYLSSIIIFLAGFSTIFHITCDGVSNVDNNILRKNACFSPDILVVKRFEKKDDWRPPTRTVYVIESSSCIGRIWTVGENYANDLWSFQSWLNVWWSDDSFLNCKNKKSTFLEKHSEKKFPLIGLIVKFDFRISGKIWKVCFLNEFVVISESKKVIPSSLNFSLICIKNINNQLNDTDEKKEQREQ